jgi:hypothetical protein
MSIQTHVAAMIAKFNRRGRLNLVHFTSATTPGDVCFGSLTHVLAAAAMSALLTIADIDRRLYERTASIGMAQTKAIPL